jgi:hypothetical protein
MLWFLLIFWVLAIGSIILFMNGSKGCGGNCEQGRKNCDCRDQRKS